MIKTQLSTWKCGLRKKGEQVEVMEEGKEDDDYDDDDELRMIF